MSSTLPAPAKAGALHSGLSPLIVLCLAATWIIWGSTYLAIKWALVSFPPFFQMGSRFVAAGLLLMAWARWRGAAWPGRREWAAATVLGALMLGGGYGFTAVAATSVSSGLLVAFIAVVPAMVALLQTAYGVRPGTMEAAGIAIGLAGIVMLTQGDGFAASAGGLAAIAFACLTWSLGTVWAVQGLPGGWKTVLAPGFMGYASQMLAGGVLLLAASATAGETVTWPLDARALACWAYLVVAGSLLAYTAYMVLLDRSTPTLASSYTYVNPVIGLLLGVTLGGETVSRFEWLAASVVLAGVVLLLAARRR